MEFFLSFLFLGLHLFDFQNNIPQVLFLGISAAIFCALFYACYKKTGDFLCSCLMMFCHTWQASWINIFGDWASDMPVTWFYVVGVIILVYSLINIRKLLTVKVAPVPLAVFVSMVLLLPYPLLISESVGEGLKEMLMIAFFVVVAFISFLFKSAVAFEKRKYVVNSFVFCMLLTSFFLLFQYVMYKTMGIALFKLSLGVYYGEATTSSKLLMDDTSCSTIIIGGAAFYLLENLNKKNWFWILTMAALLMAGIGVTSRRTSIISLAIVMVFYVVFHYRGAVKRFTMTMIVVGMMVVMLLYLSYSRSITSVSSLMSDNGRFEGYMNGIRLILKNPFGVGYDNASLASRLGGIVTHNSMLRWLEMGGVVFGILMAALLIYFISASYNRKCKTEFWFILYGLFASNFIPDILDARLFILPVMMALLFRDEEETNEERITVQPGDLLQSRL